MSTYEDEVLGRFSGAVPVEHYSYGGGGVAPGKRSLTASLHSSRHRAEPAPAAPAAPAAGAAPAAAGPGGGGALIVEAGDKAGPNQMTKPQFLSEAVQIMPGEDMDSWSNRTCADIESTLRKQVPGAAGAQNARDYLSALRQHAAAAEADGTGQADGARAALRGALTEDSATEAVRTGQLGAGRALDPTTRAAMEAAFQHSFDDVRVHTGSDAVRMASGLNARAFTVGNQIAFGASEYAPGTGAGDALLAHELAHVVQQRHATSTGRGDSGALDADADRAAASALSALHGGEMSARETAVPSLRSGVGLQRCPGGGGGAGAGALTFTSASHSPGAGGALTATPGGGGLGVQSSAYSTTGTVQATGGTDADAAAWDVGWLQTARISSRVGHYIGSPAKTKWTDSCPPNTRDGNPAGTAPWYDSANPSAKKSFTKTNTSLAVSLWDQPGTSFPWDTPDGLGKLDHTSGKDQFSSWIIVRKSAAPNTIQYINWENWEVDFSTTTNYASKGAKTVAGVTGATANSGSGAGQGGNSPTLGGKVCNDVSTQVWS